MPSSSNSTTICGIADVDWDESTIAWENAPNLAVGPSTIEAISDNFIEDIGSSATVVRHFTGTANEQDAMVDVTDFVRDPPDSAVAFTNARKVRFKGEDVDDALMSLELASKERGSDLGPQLLLSLNDLAFPSDFNSDGAVTDDLLNWQSGYGISTGATRGDASAAGDGNVEGSDFLSWQRSLAMSIVQPLLASAVPEPSSLLLALTFPFASRVRY